MWLMGLVSTGVPICPGCNLWGRLVMAHWACCQPPFTTALTAVSPQTLTHRLSKPHCRSNTALVSLNFNRELRHFIVWWKNYSMASCLNHNNYPMYWRLSIKTSSTALSYSFFIHCWIHSWHQIPIVSVSLM